MVSPPATKQNIRRAVLFSIVCIAVVGIAAIVVVTDGPSQQATTASSDNGSTSQDTQDEDEGVALSGNGTNDDPYVVTTAAELQAIDEALDAHYVLGSDINASEYSRENEFEQVGKGIGPDYKPFTGTFDGRGHAIRGMQLETPVQGGIFGMNNGTIKNLTVVDPEVSAVQERSIMPRGSGGLVSTNYGTVSDVTVQGGEITAWNSGGLVGENRGGRIANSTVRDVEVGELKTDSAAGGVVGSVNGGTVESVSVSGIVYGKEVGGIAGESTNATFENVSSQVTVNGTTAGGIVGEMWGTRIRNAIATGAVSGEKTAGGLVGTVADGNRSAIEGSLAASVVTGAEQGGGVVGSNEPRETVLTATYWDRNRTGKRHAAGDHSVDAVGLSTAEMTGMDASEQMSGLDFGTIWKPTPGYPHLRSAPEN